MTTVKVSTFIEAPRRHVWEMVSDVGSHVVWMNDAEAIKITSPRTQGVGTTFECRTKLGPLHLTDEMEVIEWKPGRAMTIRHVGAVKGVGRFSLKARRHGTLFVWKEKLQFPLWMGGPVGAAVASPFFRHVWRKNLANLKALVEGLS
ncbi:MAG: SRPBCC family protein [Acidimicrobiales bacterium]